jgi:predicted NBD/HSP70 family sugar kinase
MDIVVDIGATKTRIAAVQGAEGFAEPVVMATGREYHSVLMDLADAIPRLLAGASPGRVVVGATGQLVKSYDSFRDDLARTLRADVIVENDTALVGLGEALYGAGKGAAICVYITVSTGVNGVRIVHGAIDVSHEGFEIGGQYLSMADVPKTLEDMVSGRAICKRFGVASPKDLGKEHIVWDELAGTLAFGVHNTILHWSPDRVVIGGSMMNEVGIPLERVRKNVAAIMHKFNDVPDIVHSSLGDLGGLWGGLARLKQS